MAVVSFQKNMSGYVKKTASRAGRTGRERDRVATNVYASDAADVPSPTAPLGLKLLVGGVFLLLWVGSLLGYSAGDAAFSTSGERENISNWLGIAGAWASDISYYGFGFSAWVGVAAAVRFWLSGLALWLRKGNPKYASRKGRPMWPTWRFWLGLVVLMAAATAMEWSRLYRLEEYLPTEAGGVLGAWLGALGQDYMGFLLSGLLWVVLIVLGTSWVFRFSWLQVAERLGEKVMGVFAFVRHRREVAEDTHLGEAASKEREESVARDRVEMKKRQQVRDASAAAGSLVSAGAGGVAASLMSSIKRGTGRLMTLSGTGTKGAVGAATQADATVAQPDLTGLAGDANAVQEDSAIGAVGGATTHGMPPPVVKGRSPSDMQPVRQANLLAGLEGEPGELPSLDLLDPPRALGAPVSAESLEMTSRLIEKKLGDFGVTVTVVHASPGPVVTRYEIEPATGVKGSQIVNLAKDLARSLSLMSIRVIETIPGKAYMALELPNIKRQTIRLSEVLCTPKYQQAKSRLTVCLGQDIVGKPVVADLAKMPHVLVAGTTGSGKSVGINAMILSLLYRANPHEVKLMMIDPKMLEMSVYEGIPHLLCPVVTDMSQAGHGLNWCVHEMDRRYRLMSKMGVRSLTSYNAKIREASARGELIPNPFSLTPDQPEPLEVLPNIVVVIDELADLMMVVGKKIEQLIARLAQKARAAGMHLVLATQRPSVDVITGLIKANIPARIGFQVSSKVDSRTVLDQAGAETLLGMGDMLYLPSGAPVPTRVHGAFVSDDEVHRVVEFLKQTGEPEYIEGILEGGTLDDDNAADGVGGGAAGESDPLYDRAVEIVLKDRKSSVSYLQRKLGVGFNRAARLVEEMEKAGIVSAPNGNKPREILVPARDGGT